MIDGLGRRAAHVEDDDVAVAARGAEPRARRPRRRPGPEATTSTGFSHAVVGRIMPPLEVITRTGAVTPMRAQAAFEPVQIARMAASR